MKEEEEKWMHSISARLPLSDHEEIVRIAKKRGMTQAQVIRMIIGVGLECHRDMENLGLIGVVDFVYYVKEAMKQKGAGRQLNLPL
jgi:predicted DNA-binding protein